MSVELKIRVEHLNELPVVHLDGRVDSTTSARLDEALQGLGSSDPLGVILECKGLRYISSAGLSVLLGVVRNFGEGKSLVMCGVSENVRKVLDMVGFTKFIGMTEDAEAAGKIILGEKT